MQQQNAEAFPIDRDVQYQENIEQQPCAAEQGGFTGSLGERDAFDEIEQEIDAAEHHHQIGVQKDIGARQPSPDHCAASRKAGVPRA